MAIFGLALALGVTAFFAVRAYNHACYWHEHADEPIRQWMSVGYLAHSYHVPPPELYKAIGLPPHPPDRRPIGVIARAQNRSSQEVMVDLAKAIKRIRLSVGDPVGQKVIRP